MIANQEMIENIKERYKRLSVAGSSSAKQFREDVGYLLKEIKKLESGRIETGRPTPHQENLPRA